MAKPVLYWVLRRGWITEQAVGVTSVKGRQIYGRTLGDDNTHFSASDVAYTFPEGTTIEEVKAARDRADKERQLHEVGINMAKAEASRLEENQRQAVQAAARGVRCAVTKTPPL